MVQEFWLHIREAGLPMVVLDMALRGTCPLWSAINLHRDLICQVGYWINRFEVSELYQTQAVFCCSKPKELTLPARQVSKERRIIGWLSWCAIGTVNDFMQSAWGTWRWQNRHDFYLLIERRGEEMPSIVQGLFRSKNHAHIQLQGFIEKDMLSPSRYSCLENPRKAWQATDHRSAQSWTRLSTAPHKES